MSKLTALFGSNAGVMAAGGAVVAVAVGAGVYISSQDTGPVAEAPVVEAALTPEPTPEVEAAAPEPEVADAAPPSIDEVRLEPDGLTIIAGRAAPGSEVSVLLDGAENTSVTTDPGGSFAAITILPPSPKAQVLTVVQRVGIDEIASDDEVILAPQATPAPVVVAETAPEAEAAPEAEVAAADPVEPVSDSDVVEAAPAPQVDVEIASLPEIDDAPAPSVLQPQATAQPEAPVTQTPVTETAEATQAPVVAPVVSDDIAAVTEDAQPVVDTAPAPVEDTAEVAEVAPVAEPADPAPAVVAEQVPAPSAQETVAAVDAPDTQEAELPAPVTVLKSTAEGVQVLSNARPEALDNIELDTISYSNEGEVQLAGRAQSEAEVVRVYVDNRPVADLSVSEDGGWRGDLPDIDTGTYTLRVDELNQAGEVTSRVETPFRREDPEVLAAIDDPDAPATQITVQTGNTLWGIARERYGEGRLFVQVFEANQERIRNPDLIFPGQVFALPN